MKFNPFEVVTHNQIRAPRIVHHAAHVALGLVVGWISGRLYHDPFWLVLADAAGLAFYEKHVWLDWHRTSGTFFHPWVPYTLNVADFASDMGLTLMGALLVIGALPPLAALPIYYVLSLFNDP